MLLQEPSMDMHGPALYATQQAKELPVDLCTPEVTVHLGGCKCKWCQKPRLWVEAGMKKKHSPTLATLEEDDTLALTTVEPEAAEDVHGPAASGKGNPCGRPALPPW
ncbi:unnamed protein product [Symbiodinium sp. CCMP2592]|nr:unnamed protein product [Symbiodinium sp. CCMP2592]